MILSREKAMAVSGMGKCGSLLSSSGQPGGERSHTDSGDASLAIVMHRQGFSYQGKNGQIIGSKVTQTR